MSVGLNKNNTFSVFAYNQRSCSFLERPQRMTPSLRHDVVSGGIFVWVFLFNAKSGCSIRLKEKLYMVSTSTIV